jgi:hypothetical protein
MKRIKLLGLALLALFALSAVASSVAAAEMPEILPAPTEKEPLKFTSKTKAGTKPFLESTKLLRITCEKADNKGSFTTQDKGTGLILFDGCKEETSGAKCSNTATAGQIITEGEFQLVDILPTSTLALGLWLKPESDPKGKDLEFKCGVLGDIVLGSLIGAIDKVTSGVGTKLWEVLWHQKLGEQEIKTCELLKALCSTGPFTLTSKLTAAGAEELSAEEAEAEIEFVNNVVVDF